MSALIWPAAAGTPAKGASARHSAVEREVKLAVPDLDAVEARLLALVGYGARCSGEVHEFNYVLDTAQDELKGRGERLRIRDIMGRPGVQVTWKGPARLRNGVRRREEREFQADNRDACVAVFANLGLRLVCTYEKYRSSWRLNDTIICLDRLAFGTFVEIELTAEVSEESEAAALQRSMALLGLLDAPRVKASYARLQQEWQADRPKQQRLRARGRLLAIT